MSNVQKIKVAEMDCSAVGDFGGRVETGAVQFTYPDGNEDWNGYFIRGDNAFHIALEIGSLEAALEKAMDSLPPDVRDQIQWHLHTLTGLKNDIMGNTIVQKQETVADFLKSINEDLKG
jgi:hypothetical protein